MYSWNYPIKHTNVRLINFFLFWFLSQLDFYLKNRFSGQTWFPKLLVSFVSILRIN
jgi:hypothetical protein